MLVVLVVLGVFVLTGAGLGLIGAAVTVVADLLDSPGDPLPTRAKVLLVAILAGVGAIVTQAVASKTGLTFDIPLATQFVTILGAAFVTFFGVTKPVGLSSAVRGVSIPVLSPVVSTVAAAVASPVSTVTGVLAAVPNPFSGPTKKQLAQQVADLSSAQGAQAPAPTGSATPPLPDGVPGQPPQ